MFNNHPIDHFDKRPVKESLEDYLYTKIGSVMQSHVLQITGPAISRHYDNALKIAPTNKFKIFWIDAERGVYEGIRRRFIDLGISSHKVKLAFGNVFDYEQKFGLKVPCRFEDLDLCGALSGTKFLIAHRLLTQAKTYPSQNPNLIKCLMFTAALRPEGMEVLLQKHFNTILNPIGVILSPRETYANGYNNIMPGVFEWKPVFLQTGRLLKHMWLYSYKDTHQMLTCVIVYKTGRP